MTMHQKIPMTVDAFLAWAEGQPGRYELVDGEPVRMAPERARHNIVKGRVFIALRDAIAKAGLACEVFTDGMTVRIDDTVAREPDAAVQCGHTQDLDSTVLAAPLIVVEVVSPSSGPMDAEIKLSDYFKVTSIKHYLIVSPETQTIVHHRRDGDTIHKRIVTEGSVQLDPPGVALPLAGLWPV